MTTALEHLLQAKMHYIKGFRPRHPKVAWAVEAQANVHKKMHNYSLAIACINEAIQLRKGLQDKSDGKALFSSEIAKDDAALKALEARQSTANKLKNAKRVGSLFHPARPGRPESALPFTPPAPATRRPTQPPPSTNHIERRGRVLSASMC